MKPWKNQALIKPLQPLQWQSASFPRITMEDILLLYSACMEISIGAVTTVQTNINLGMEMKDSRVAGISCWAALTSALRRLKNIKLWSTSHQEQSGHNITELCNRSTIGWKCQDIYVLYNIPVYGEWMQMTICQPSFYIKALSCV